MSRLENVNNSNMKKVRETCMLHVEIEPLSQQGFKPFGDVIEQLETGSDANYGILISY